MLEHVKKGGSLEEDQDAWDSVLDWHKLYFTGDFEDSKSWRESDRPAVILASSGMCTNGRSVAWVKKLLPDADSHVIFCGYSAEDTIAQKIKEDKDNRFIKIDGQILANKCGITILNSFSSHACHEELTSIYRGAQYSRLVLVHSDFDSKCVFAEELRGYLADDGRTSRVVAANEGLKFSV